MLFLVLLLDAAQQQNQKQQLLVLNFSPRHDERSWLLNTLFANVSWATILPVRQAANHSEWLYDMSRYKFAISPRGNGLDCHRTWEMLAIGVIPIVLSSSLDSVFRDIPAVLIVEDWTHVTKEVLERHWDKYGASLHSEDVSTQLTQQFWMNKIFLRTQNQTCGTGTFFCRRNILGYM